MNKSDILVVGDWLVDEHWVVGKHRALSSSRTGRDHSRALHDHTSSVRSLCGAGQVASILHEARDANGVNPFQITGIGLWHRGDERLLANMLTPRSNVGHTPHVLGQPQPPEGQLPELHNLACEGVMAGTTRVIRIYTRTEDRPDLKQRVDWELPLKPSDHQNIWSKLTESLKALASLENLVKHIVVKDLGKGVITEQLIDYLRVKFPEAHWYISSKSWLPEWLRTLPNGQVRLLLIPQLAAVRAIRDGAISSASWLTTEGVPTKDALEVMDDLGEKFPAARLVVLPEGTRLLAREPRDGGIAGGYLVPHSQTDLPFTPMASVFFPALLAQMVTGSHNQQLGLQLEAALQYTGKWASNEARRLILENWQPPEEQILDLSNKNTSGVSAKLHNVLPFDFNRARKDWQSAYQKTGIVEVVDPQDASNIQREFHIWRATTELDGYVTCIKTKRKHVLHLVEAGRTLISTAREERRGKSFLVIDAPGSGKSYMVDCLAKTLGLKTLKFNVTQMRTRQDLTGCFQVIAAAQSQSRDRALLVFVDEINSLLDGHHVFDAFLEPLEDGTFVNGGSTFHLDPCLWIFAGTEFSSGQQATEHLPDFESRLSAPVMRLNDQSDDKDFQELRSVEQVYIGVAAIRNAFEDVNKVSSRILDAFRILPSSVGPRGIRRLVRSLEYVQYGRVMAHNLPRGWSDTMRIEHNLLRNWEDSHKNETLIEIKSKS